MEPWIIITFGAAAAQTWRFMLQKRLASGVLSASGATFARFVFAAPLALLAAAAHGGLSGQGWPGIPARFWPWAVAGGVAQILATICVVLLFSQRNFAVGITFKKTEVLLSVPVGLALLGEGIGLGAFAALVGGLAGVLLLSGAPGGTARGVAGLRSPAAGLGLASGLCFALSGVGYRAASLSLDGDALLRALVTLTCVTAVQTLLLGFWLIWRQPGEVRKVFRAWRVTALVGVASMLGSACWFTAFTLQTVALVNAVGQVELVFSALVSVLVFGERISPREALGMTVLGGSILALILLV